MLGIIKSLQRRSMSRWRRTTSVDGVRSFMGLSVTQIDCTQTVRARSMIGNIGRKSPAAGSTAVVLLMLSTGAAVAAQPLETETARLPAQGHGSAQLVFEYQTSSQGQEFAIPLVLEYGITDRLEITVEPVAFVSIQPKGAASASGFGDTEAALTYRVFDETPSWPAVAIAGEIKFPTTSDKLIGTGKTDYRGFIIASKRFGNFDVHANLGYTFVGSPPGTSLGDIVDFAAAVEYQVDSQLTLVAEVIGNTSAGGTESGPVVTQEAAGNELVGLVGARYQASERLALSLGVTYDNNNAVLIRPGITFDF